MTAVPDPDGELLTPAEVGALFRVDGNSVTRWANQGRFPEGSFIWTPGGRRRYRAGPVRRLLTDWKQS